jgi:hypothetical protein
MDILGPYERIASSKSKKKNLQKEEKRDLQEEEREYSELSA